MHQHLGPAVPGRGTPAVGPDRQQCERGHRDGGDRPVSQAHAGTGTHGAAEAPPRGCEGAARRELDAILKRYPTKQAALLPALWIVQQRQGWGSPAAMAEVAEVLGLTVAYVK
ncbi:MAG: hypothetical protein FIA95_09850, partial [Gemmatimonadetes bacterium]|nr:hypothetical protein [Gemmatimonadota bacterium]